MPVLVALFCVNESMQVFHMSEEFIRLERHGKYETSQITYI